LLLHLQSSPLPRIAIPVDIVKNIEPGLGSRLVRLPIHPLTFEHAKEALAAVLSAELSTVLMLQMT